MVQPHWDGVTNDHLAAVADKVILMEPIGLLLTGHEAASGSACHCR